MLHIRLASDAVPHVGAASRRAVAAVRYTIDEAPGVDGGPRVLVLERISLMLAEVFAEIEVLLSRSLETAEARGPPR